MAQLATALDRATSRAQTITDDVTIGGPILLPPTAARGSGYHSGSPNSRPRRLKVTARATTEYVAGTPSAATLNIPRALPWSLDEVTRDFGDDIYDRMRVDPKIASNLIVLKANVLEDGLTLSPALDNKAADGYDLAVQIMDECTAMLDALEPSLDDTLWAMMESLEYGHKVAELVYTLAPSPTTGEQRLLLTGVKPKPRRATAFVVDAQTNVLGVLALIPGLSFPVQAGMLFGDLERTPNLLPRDKFLVHSFRMRDSDPRGTSLLRPAFAAYNAKQELIGDYLRHMGMFGSPSVHGIAAEGAVATQAQDATGTLLWIDNGDGTRSPLMLTPEDMLLAALEQVRNGGVVATTFGSEIRYLTTSGEGAAFLAALDYFDKMVTFTMLQQTLATEEGRHQTRAATSGQKDILDTIIRQVKRSLCRAFRRDALRHYVLYNYGAAVAQKLTPLCHLGTVAAEDRTEFMGAVTTYASSGVATQAQLPALDALLGLPVRDQGDPLFMPATQSPMEAGSGDAPPATARGAPAGKSAGPAQPATATDDGGSADDTRNERADDADGKRKGTVA